ncbi:MAG: SRPBCC family protein [Mycobacteriaceae bacterium]|nr:SRPBCC family protein [Mycobacteriaceae bacterium]
MRIVTTAAVAAVAMSIPTGAAAAAPTPVLCATHTHGDSAGTRSHRQFTQEVAIAGAQVGDVVDLLSDPRRLGEIHPLLANVVQDRATADVDGGTVAHYTMTDRMTVAGLPVSFQYTTEMRRCGPGRIGSRARQFPDIDLYSAMSVTPAPGGVRVTELTDFLAPAPLMEFTFEQGQNAHRTMFGNLKAKFTGTPRGAR